MNSNDVPFALYGTLRRGGRLHRAYGIDRCLFMGSGIVEGFSLYVCRGESFPRASHSAIGSIRVELYMPTESIASKVIAMERGAGYSLETALAGLDDGQSMVVRLFTSPLPPSGFKEVPGGDWFS